MMSLETGGWGCREVQNNKEERSKVGARRGSMQSNEKAEEVGGKVKEKRKEDL